MDKSTLRILYILLVLLTPNKYFEVYYIVLLSFIIFTKGSKFKFHRYELIILSYVFIISSIRMILWQEIGDLKEVIKISFLTITMSFIRQDNIGLKSKTLYLCLGLFTVLNFISSISLSFNLIKPLNQFILENYVSDSQRILYTYNSIRSTGLSPGVGQQGITSFLCFSFFLMHRRSNRKNLILISISLITLFLSQSKTAFIISILFLTYRLRNNKFFLFTMATIISYLIFVFQNILEKYLRELSSLFKQVQFSSWNARIENWKELFDPMLEMPVSIFVGIGRSYFDSINLSSSVYDNDYVYLIVNYGIIGLVIFGLVNFSFLKTSFTDLKIMIVLLLLGGIALNPFFDPKTFTIIFLLIFYFKQQYAKKDMLDFS